MRRWSARSRTPSKWASTPQTGAVQAMLDLESGGSVRDATQRIWAQAEYLRALTLRPDSEASVLRQLQALQQRSLHARRLV